MKLSVLQENLNRVVSAAARCVASRPQLPILANVLLRAEKGRLVAIGTDLTTTVGLSTGGKVVKEGAIAVMARDLAALTGSLSPGRVGLEAENGKLKVVAGSTTASLVGVPASEFPDVSGKASSGLEIATGEFVRAVERTQFCVSADEGRPILTGVRIEPINRSTDQPINKKRSDLEGTKGKKGVKGGGLRLAATDGYRLSLVDVEKVSGKLEDGIIVPGRTLAEAMRLASPGKRDSGEQAGEKLELALSADGEIQIRFEDGWIQGKLLAGEFPSVEEILPKTSELAIGVDREELEKAARVAAIFARESANIVKFKIQNSPTQSGRASLKVSANSPQIGENETVLEVDGKGSGEIAFNSRYLLDWLGSVSSVERIVFRMTGPLKPGLFMVEGDDSYRHVIMPVRVQK